MKARVLLLMLLVAASVDAGAQEFTTSRGVRTLPRVESLLTEASARQATQAADDVLTELLLDVATSEQQRALLLAEASAIAQKQKTEQGSIDKASTRFDEMDRKYKENLAAFERRSAEIESEAVRQRAEVTALEAIPSAQRDYPTVERLNKWAADIGARRTVLEREREALMREHEQVEAERQSAARVKTDAQARLESLRSDVQGRFAKHSLRQAQLYRQLRQCVAYMNSARAKLRARVSQPLEHSATLDKANERLRVFGARSPK